MPQKELKPLPDSPLVSIVILNYKRRDALKRVLQTVQSQDYRNREVILVDNNSQDGIASFVAEEASFVRLIELTGNRGACGGRNAGIEAAKGDIIITLDNDIFFETPQELSKLVDTFKAHPDYHVLAMFLGDPETGAVRSREWCHPRNIAEFSEQQFETYYFVEGAAAYRREVLESAGMYYEPIFLGNEGHDLALRILDKGFRILYAPNVRARHLMAADTRSSERTFYIYTRNYIWISYKDYHFWDGLWFLVPKILMMAFFSLRTGHLWAYLRGLKDGVKGLRQIGKERTPISRHTAALIDEMDKFRPNWRVRLARHRGNPQI